ncbi:MAG: hypothetical protein Q9195_004492 [Heterodermia aff. obscurata]
MAMPHAKKLRKEQQRQQRRAHGEADPLKEATHSNSDDMDCRNCGRSFKTATRYAIHVAWCDNDCRCAQCPEKHTKYATDHALHRHWEFSHKIPRNKEQLECESHPRDFRPREYKPTGAHKLQKCRFCKAKIFPGDREKHEREKHPPEHEDERNHREHKKPSSSGPKTYQKPVTPPPLPDHYMLLGIARNASADDIKRAARLMRVLCHPDRFRRNDPTPEEIVQIEERAKNVGWAADILCNEETKKRYDEKWNSFHN